jgi:hypothetical protein
MQIVVNHVTRMRAPRICVAGIETNTLEHVRPTTRATEPITRALLRSEGGPFGPGALVDLGDVVSEGVRPEVEDHRFATARARHVEDLGDELYLKVLDNVKHDGLETAFGPDVREIRPRKLAVPAGRGERSLAVIEVETPRLYIDSWGKLFLDVEEDIEAKLRVTDIRFYEADQDAVDREVVEDVSGRLLNGVKTYAMVGLARAMQDQDAGDVHWLQCNGLCLADRAVGDVP